MQTPMSIMCPLTGGEGHMSSKDAIHEHKEYERKEWSRECMRTSRPPRIRCPLGEFLLPLTRCQMPPPTAPMPKAPPMSPMILYGQGSLP